MIRKILVLTALGILAFSEDNYSHMWYSFNQETTNGIYLKATFKNGREIAYTEANSNRNFVSSYNDAVYVGYGKFLSRDTFSSGVRIKEAPFFRAQ